MNRTDIKYVQLYIQARGVGFFYLSIEIIYVMAAYMKCITAFPVSLGRRYENEFFVGKYWER